MLVDGHWDGSGDWGGLIFVPSVDELQEFNRAVGYLLGRPDMETAANPLAPTTIVQAFTEALHSIKGEASALNLMSIANRVHALEDMVSELKKKSRYQQDVY